MRPLVAAVIACIVIAVPHPPALASGHPVRHSADTRPIAPSDARQGAGAETPAARAARATPPARPAASTSPDARPATGTGDDAQTTRGAAPAARSSVRRADRADTPGDAGSPADAHQPGQSPLPDPFRSSSPEDTALPPQFRTTPSAAPPVPSRTVPGPAFLPPEVPAPPAGAAHRADASLPAAAHEPPAGSEAAHEQEPELIGEQLAEWLDHHVQHGWVPWLEKLLCAEHFEFRTRLEQQPRGLQPIPERPPLILEWNELFLGPGPLQPGIELPTGAVWRPAFWVFGEHRVDIAHQALPNGAPDQAPGLRFTELVQRLDLFGQLNLTGTERILIGYRPFDQQVSPDGVAVIRRFSAYDFQSGDALDGYNADIQTLFFEGDFGEIFPNLDLYDRNQLDYGFSVGRQPLLAQQGLLLNEDRIDAVTITRNTLSGSGVLNLRMTAVYAWGQITRNDTRPFVTRNDPDAQLFALLTETDLARTTINADIVYVDSSEAVGSQLAFGLSAIQRIAGAHQRFNTSFHVLGSFPTDGETTTAGRGWLLFSRVSWTPHRTLDLVYANAFWAIDQFTSPARGPLEGGPIGGSLGLLYTVSGVGRFGPPLSNQTSQAFGGSLGYQLMFDETRTQLILEVGGRQDTSGRGNSAVAAGFRFQRAMGQHWVWLVDGFLAKQESRDLAHGARVELLTRF